MQPPPGLMLVLSESARFPLEGNTAPWVQWTFCVIVPLCACGIARASKGATHVNDGKECNLPVRPPFFDAEVASERPAHHVRSEESGAANMGNSAEFGGGLLFVCGILRLSVKFDAAARARLNWITRARPPSLVGKGLRGNI